MALTVEELQVIISANEKEFNKAFDRVDKKLDEVNKSTEKVSNNLGNKLTASLDSVRSRMSTLIKVGVAGLGGGLIGLGGASLKAANSFEKMGVALETSFQGNVEEAQKAQKAITDFAAKTPYELQEVMTGFIKLKNMGLDPSREALTAYGDTASAMGKGLNDMVEAVADAATGEFERLKEFGIRASQQGDKVTFTFKGVSTTVKKDSKSIEDYLIKLGQTNFAGGMEKQSKTLGGTLATLKDNFGLALSEIANKSGLLDGAKNVVSRLGGAIENLTPKMVGIFQAMSSDDADDSFNILSKVFSPGMADKINRFLGVIKVTKTGVELLFKAFKSGDFSPLYAFFERIDSGLGSTAVKLIETLYSGVRNFINFLLENKGPTVAAIMAIGAVILSTYVPAMVAAVTASLPIIALFAAIGAAAFVLKKAWDENWGGMRDKLTALWSTMQPVFAQIWDWLSVMIPQAIGVLKTWWDNNWPAISESLNNIWNNVLKPIFSAIVNYYEWFIPNALKALKWAWDNLLVPAFQVLQWWWGNVIGPVFKGIVNFLEGALVGSIKAFKWTWDNILSPIWTGLKWTYDNILQPIFSGIDKGFNAVGETIKKAGNMVKDAWNIITGVGGNLWDALRGILNEKIIDPFNRFQFKIDLGFKTIHQDLPDLPRFDVGINRVPKDMIAQIHKDEAIVPANMNPFNPNADMNGSGVGGKEVNFTVNNYDTNIDAGELAEQFMFRFKMA